MKTKPLFKYFLPVLGVGAITTGLLTIPLLVNNSKEHSTLPTANQKVSFAKNTPTYKKVYDNQNLKLGVQLEDSQSSYHYAWYYLTPQNAGKDKWESFIDANHKDLIIPADQVSGYNNCLVKCVVSNDNQVILTSQPTFLEVVRTHFDIQTVPIVYPDQNQDYNLSVHLKTDPALSNDQFEYNWYGLNNQTDSKQLIQSSTNNQLITSNPKHFTGFQCVVKDLTTNHSETSSIIQVNNHTIRFVQKPRVTNLYVDGHQVYLQISNPAVSKKLSQADIKYQLYGWNHIQQKWEKINYQSYWSNWLSFSNNDDFSSYKIKAVYQSNEHHQLVIYDQCDSESFGLKLTTQNEISINYQQWTQFISSDPFQKLIIDNSLDYDGSINNTDLDSWAKLMGINNPQAVANINYSVSQKHLQSFSVSLKPGYQWNKYTKTLLNYNVTVVQNTLTWHLESTRNIKLKWHPQTHLANLARFAADSKMPLWEMVDQNGNVLPQYLNYFINIIGIPYPNAVKNIVLLKSNQVVDNKYTLNLIIVLKPHFKWDPKIQQTWPDSKIDGRILMINNIPLDILVQSPVTINYGTLTNYISQVDQSNYEQTLFVDKQGNVNPSKLSLLAQLIGLNEPQVVTSIQVQPGTKKMVNDHYTLKLIINLKNTAKWNLKQVLEGCGSLSVSLTDQGLIIDDIPTKAGLTAVNFDYQKCQNWVLDGFSPKYINNLKELLHDLLTKKKYDILGSVMGVSDPKAISNITLNVPTDTPVNPTNNMYYLNASISLKPDYKWVLPQPLPSPFLSVEGSTLTIKYLQTSIPAQAPSPSQPTPSPHPNLQIAKVTNGLGRSLENFYRMNNKVLESIVPGIFGSPNNLQEQQWLAATTLGISEAASRKISHFSTTAVTDSENGYFKFNLTATFSDTYRWDKKQIEQAIFNYHGSNFDIQITNQGKTLTLYNLWSQIPNAYYADHDLVNWTGWKTTAQTFEYTNVLPILKDMIDLGGTTKEFTIADSEQDPELVNQLCQYLGISTPQGVYKIRFTFQGAHSIYNLNPALPDWVKLPYLYYQQLNISVQLKPTWRFTPQSFISSPLSWEGASTVAFSENGQEPWICRSFLIGIPGYPIKLSIDKIKQNIYGQANQWKSLLNENNKSISWSSSNLEQLAFLKELGQAYGINTQGAPVMDNRYPIASVNWRMTNFPNYYALTIKLCVDDNKWYCFDGSLSPNPYNPDPAPYQCSWDNVQNGGYFVYPFNYWFTMFFKL